MFQPDFNQTADPQPADWRRLSGAAGLAAFHCRRAWRVGHAVCPAGALSGSRIVTPFLDGISKLGLDLPGIPDLGRLNERLEPLDRLALCVGAGAGPGRRLLRHAGRTGLSDRQFHPLGRQPRLSGGARLLSTTYSAMCRCWRMSRWPG